MRSGGGSLLVDQDLIGFLLVGEVASFPGVLPPGEKDRNINHSKSNTRSTILANMTIMTGQIKICLHCKVVFIARP